ncbi:MULTISPECIES: hypothetical protein [unclassified Vibrio]|uniref:Uncharacterized protein n=1 Tax=Vibrio sp. HB236076 TaxID=3232307 RepID=A0AB39HEV1_9VIBR|nr:hypothetical protein [Vibrio sp. HB161653]MDP5252854.1 hypothetical protein [Vibrio sp. HB161653]
MGIREKVAALEQQIYVAYSEGDYQMVNHLEQQIERLQGWQHDHSDDLPHHFVDPWQDDER